MCSPDLPQFTFRGFPTYPFMDSVRDDQKVGELHADCPDMDLNSDQVIRI